jgi:transcriptional regulator with XRE-family HTH domain
MTTAPAFKPALAAIRRATGLTQTQLAARLGVGQAAVSKIERHSDMLVGTLAGYLSALGVDAQIFVKIGEQSITSDLTVHRRAR